MDVGSRHCTVNRYQDHPPQKRNAKRQNGLRKSLQLSEKRREAKGKGENKRYIHLSAEFQRLASLIDKKAFLTDQCKKDRGKQ